MNPKESEREEGLSWAGDSDNGLIEFDPDASAETPGAVPVAAPTANIPAEQRATLPAVGYGIFVGIFLLYVAGWAIFIFSHPVTHLGDLLPAVMYELGEALAIVAPILWSLPCLWGFNVSGVGLRMLWLAIGAIVLVPWPFIMSAVIA